MDEVCADSGNFKHLQVTWCPVWGVWLCAECRNRRAQAEVTRTCGQEEMIVTDAQQVVL